MTISLMCGFRESDYKMDGYSTSLVDFGVITINMSKENVEYKDMSFVLFSGTQKYDGYLVENPFDGSYVADIKKVLDKEANTNIVVNVKGQDYSLKLKNVGSDWSFTIDDALKKFAKDYKEKIMILCENKELLGEVYIKILNDEKFESEDYYYLICVVGRKGESIRVIYSPFNGEILASNTNI